VIDVDKQRKRAVKKVASRDWTWLFAKENMESHMSVTGGRAANF
jgi:hypothetical protein